jgi:phenylacetate-CoA ligase
MSIYHLSRDTAPDYIRCLSKRSDEVLEGFPSALGILADFILELGERVPMRVVFTDGEPLYPFLRTKIEKAFGTRVFNCYGNTEACGLIQECEHGSMHLIPDYGYLEILDDANRLVSDPGVEGFFVWTGFINDTMPLIRYRIGDRGCWGAQEPCVCGRTFSIVVPTITRESDLLRCPDGRIFSPRSVNQLLKQATSFRFCQFVQTESEHIIVRAVATKGKGPQELSVVRDQLQKLLGGQVRITAELADAPLVRAGGKIPLIVQRVKW